MARPFLLHLISPAEWRTALAAGSVVPPSLVLPGAGSFVHLSTPEQVHLPANRLFAGRPDLLLLVVDPERLIDPVRFEPGVPTDPESMRFPHLYGPLPVAAVTSVVPYRPDADGRYQAPEGLPHPDDLAARARSFDRSMVERRAAAVSFSDCGVAVLDPRVPRSYAHNTLWLDRPATADEIRQAVAPIAPAGHLAVCSDHGLPDDLGWPVEVERVMVLPPSAPVPNPAEGTQVTSVTTEVMAAIWAPTWRSRLPVDAATEETIHQLIHREALTDAHLMVVDLAVLGGDGKPVASAQLRIDGATASIEAVMTGPEHRGDGLATAVVKEAITRARAGGCDLIWLVARADDWPIGWYSRLGFEVVGDRASAVVAASPR